MSAEDISRLARRAGLLVEWDDAAGEHQVTPPETLARVLGALGFPAGSPSEITAGLERLDAEAAEIPPLVTADAGRPVVLPAGIADGPAQLRLESGEARDLRLTRRKDHVEAPAIAEPGYHRLETRGAEITLAVAPARAWTVQDAARGRRVWGLGLQLYSLREPGAPGSRRL